MSWLSPSLVVAKIAMVEQGRGGGRWRGGAYGRLEFVALVLVTIYVQRAVGAVSEKEDVVVGGCRVVKLSRVRRRKSS